VKLNENQMERYSRHILLPEIGAAGQRRLLSSSVLVIGVGGLGSPAAIYLAAAGVGTIGIVDPDRVDLTNLQRQVVHFTKDLGREKVDSARAKLKAINPEVTVNIYPERLQAATIDRVIQPYDFVIDATDNFTAKFLINDACYFAKKAFSHAGVLGFRGQITTVLPARSACYRCIFKSPPPRGVVPRGSESGIFGVAPGVIGALQATEAIKYLLGIGTLLTNAMLVYDSLDMDFQKIDVKRDPECPICGKNPHITALRDEE
jgi:molybdopterin/thiamine biosynthesis adenylyltransferase